MKRINKCDLNGRKSATAYQTHAVLVAQSLIRNVGNSLRMHRWFLSCIYIVPSRRCWLCWGVEVANKTPAEADAKCFVFFPGSLSAFHYNIFHHLIKSGSRWKMTPHRDRGSDFVRQVHRGLFSFVFWAAAFLAKWLWFPKNFKGTKEKRWQLPKTGLIQCFSFQRCSRRRVHGVLDQQSVRLWVVMHSFWSQMWHSPRLHSSTCLYRILQKSELHPALCHYRMNSFSTTRPIHLKKKKKNRFQKVNKITTWADSVEKKLLGVPVLRQVGWEAVFEESKCKPYVKHWAIWNFNPYFAGKKLHSLIKMGQMIQSELLKGWCGCWLTLCPTSCSSISLISWLRPLQIYLHFVYAAFSLRWPWQSPS